MSGVYSEMKLYFTAGWRVEAWVANPIEKPGVRSVAPFVFFVLQDGVVILSNRSN